MGCQSGAKSNMQARTDDDAPETSMVGESTAVTVLPLRVALVLTAATCKPLNAVTPTNSAPGVASWLTSCAHGPPVAACAAAHDDDAAGGKAIVAATTTLPCVTEVMKTVAEG